MVLIGGWKAYGYRIKLVWFMCRLVYLTSFLDAGWVVKTSVALIQSVSRGESKFPWDQTYVPYYEISLGGQLTVYFGDCDPPTSGRRFARYYFLRHALRTIRVRVIRKWLIFRFTWRYVCNGIQRKLTIASMKNSFCEKQLRRCRRMCNLTSSLLGLSSHCRFLFSRFVYCAK